MDQATFEANARSIRERFTGARRDLMLRLNDAGGSMDVFDLLRSKDSPLPAIRALVLMHDSGLVVIDGWVVRLP